MKTYKIDACDIIAESNNSYIIEAENKEEALYKSMIENVRNTYEGAIVDMEQCILDMKLENLDANEIISNCGNTGLYFIIKEL